MIITLMKKIGLPAIAAAFTAVGLVFGEGRSKTHVVVDHDTLWDLSAKYLGSPWKWNEIWDLNRAGVPNPDLIYPGQELEVPGPGAAAPEEEEPAPAIEPEPVPAPVPPAAAPPAEDSRAPETPEPAPQAEPWRKEIGRAYPHDGSMKASGKVIRESAGSALMEAGDRVLVRLDRRAEVGPGTVLLVYRKRNFLLDKKKGVELDGGTYFDDILGAVILRERRSSMKWAAEIAAVNTPVEPGDLLKFPGRP